MVFLEQNVRVYERFSRASYLFYSIHRVGKNKPVISFERSIFRSISAGGLFFETFSLKESILKRLSRGEYQFLLQVELSEMTQPLTLWSRVCWCKGASDYLESHKNGFGVEFIDIAQTQRERLQDFVAGQILKMV